jgi:hypothetical protein
VTLRYTLPVTARLLRITFTNGQTKDPDDGSTDVRAYMRAARVCQADIVLSEARVIEHGASERRFPLVFPDAPGLFRVTHDFGYAREVTLVIRSWYRGRAGSHVKNHVALSGIRFVALAPGSPAPQTVASPPMAAPRLYSSAPFQTGNPGIKLCAVYDGTPPDPTCKKDERLKLAEVIAKVSGPPR